MAKFRDGLPHPTDVPIGEHIHFGGTFDTTVLRHEQWTIESHGVDKTAFAAISGEFLSNQWKNMERKFLANLRGELKADHRRTHRTPSANRTMSKRKRAGSRRWPVSS